MIWGYSSAGRAIRSQRIGQGFESPYLHFQCRNCDLTTVPVIFLFKYLVRRDDIYLSDTSFVPTTASFIAGPHTITKTFAKDGLFIASFYHPGQH